MFHLCKTGTTYAYVRRTMPGIRLQEAIEACVRAKQVANLRPAYVRSLRLYLNQFARGRENFPIEGCDEGVIEEWFAGRSEKPSTRAANLGRLAALFSYAYRRRWIEENPCDRVERVRIERRAPQILTVQQAGAVLRFTREERPQRLAWLALCLLAGLRPEEPLRHTYKPQGVTWSDVNLDNGTVRIDAATTKVSNRRIVELTPNAVAWLALARDLGAQLPIELMSKRRHQGLMRRLLGFEVWPQDILRHTAASYMVAATSNLPKVACNLGNSPAILARHYRELVTREQADAFWGILPDSPQLELNL